MQSHTSKIIRRLKYLEWKVGQWVGGGRAQAWGGGSTPAWEGPEATLQKLGFGWLCGDEEKPVLPGGRVKLRDYVQDKL